MLRKLATFVLLSACCLAGYAGQQAATQPERFFFILMADPQIPWGPRELWEKAIAEANRLKPAFVVVCGDLTHPTGDAEQTRQYLETARKLARSIPLYNVSGNHDVGNEPTPESLAWYRKHYGKLYDTFTYGNCLFIVLESDLMRAPGKVQDEADRQMTWLKRTLAESDGKGYRHRMVFMHHPVSVAGIDQFAGWGLPLPQRKEFLKLLHAHNVTAVFSGHFHRNAYLRDGRLELITTASTGKPLGEDPPGFRIVKVYPDRIEHAYYTYEQMPKQVSLSK